MEKRNYSRVYRLIHWSMALCVLLLLITIFLRLTWMNKDHVADIIEKYLADSDITLSRPDLIVLAKKIRKPMWDWHIYLGYILTFLFCIRLIVPFFGQMKFSNPIKKQTPFWIRFQYWTYLIFYACLFITLTTGLIIELGPKSMKKSMENIHVLSLYYLIPFLIIHLSGVFYAEFKTDRGIISRIISGREKP